MNISTLTESADLQRYDRWLRSHPQGSLWQSLEWKRYQEALGRETKLYVERENNAIVASALVIIDRTSFGLSTWDCMRGPVEQVGVSGQRSADDLMASIVADAKRKRGMTVFFSPMTQLIADRSTLIASSRHEKPEATIIVDLTQTEEQILQQMHPKGRYNIRLAQKHGVTVTASHDVDAFYALLQQTSARDKFGMLQQSHYRRFLENLDQSFMLLAMHAGKPIAGVLGVMWNGMGIYYYGASDHTHRALMAPYLLQWDAMRLCKAAGCVSYDLLGIAPPGRANHAWAGVTDFKRKFGGTVVEYPKEREMVLQKMMKTLLALKRQLF